MGTRSMNFIALKHGVQLNSEIVKYLGNPELDTARGTLFIYESNFTPMYARDGKGVHCTFDLEEEIAIHRFLGSLPLNAFYMVRTGDEFGRRGMWEDHGFGAENETVADLQKQFDDVVREEEDEFARQREAAISAQQ